MSEDSSRHSRLLTPEDAQRWRERVRHGTAPNGVLVMVDEIERLYEQYAALEEKSERQATNIGALYRQRRRVEEQLEAAQEALVFYADESNWYGSYTSDMGRKARNVMDRLRAVQAVSSTASSPPDPAGYIELDDDHNCPHGVHKGLGCRTCDPARNPS